MRVELIGHDHRYAVEQMVLMLLGQTVTYDGQSSDWGQVILGEDRRSARARFRVSGVECHGQIDAHELGLDTPTDQKAVEQHLVKLAAYRALVQVTGPQPWGALSGVRPAKLVTKWLRAGASSVDCASLLTGLYGLEREKAVLAIRCAQVSRHVEEDLSPGDVSLYIGVPFCPTRCAYCSFISADVKGALALVDPYVEALGAEIDWAGRLLREKGLRLRSIYVGGGTPTTLSPSQLDFLLSRLDLWLDRGPLVEFTVEAGRPDTITPQKLAVLRDHGVDRVSVNPQTLSDSVLRAIGRAHTADRFREAYSLARDAGFTAVNTDLIAGLPTDTLEGFRRTLSEILTLAPEEITLHTLALKHGSALLKDPQKLPDGETVAQMLKTAHGAFTSHGYQPYYLYRQKYMTGSLENVGWTRRGDGSFYNVVMMEELHSVLALGSAGVTKLVDRRRGSIQRLNNPKYPKEYLERLPDTMKAREEAL